MTVVVCGMFVIMGDVIVYFWGCHGVRFKWICLITQPEVTIESNHFFKIPMKIGELAQVAQCSVETVRYYEKEGLLPEPARTSGNFRVYGADHLERLRFIRNCRALDMSHEEIHTLLRLADQPADDCGAINSVFDEHIAHVDERIQELVLLKTQLSVLRQRCETAHAVDDCGILLGLAAMETEPKPPRHTHLG